MWYRLFSVAVIFLFSFLTSGYADLELWVGDGEVYATIMDAVEAIPQPATDNVMIQVKIPPAGYYEDGMDLDISTINMSGYSLDVVAVSPEMIVTWYVGDDIEYRQTGDNAVDIIETVTGGEHLARRVHTNSYNDAEDYQFYIKNHLGSTMTMVDQYGIRSGPVFDYFPYGKQVEEEVTTDAPVTPTFTGKELDLFENDFASGEDGEGWYYFGARY